MKIATNNLKDLLKNKLDTSAKQIPKEEISFEVIKPQVQKPHLQSIDKSRVRKNIVITGKHQNMLDEIEKNFQKINLSSIIRREIEKIYEEYKSKK